MNVALFSLKKKSLIRRMEVLMREEGVLADGEGLEDMAVIPKKETVSRLYSPEQLDALLATEIGSIEFCDYDNSIHSICRQKGITTLGQITRDEGWNQRHKDGRSVGARIKKAVWQTVGELGVKMAHFSGHGPYPIGPKEQDVISQYKASLKS